jgi:hypothetical protein
VPALWLPSGGSGGLGEREVSGFPASFDLREIQHDARFYTVREKFPDFSLAFIYTVRVI